MQSTVAGKAGSGVLVSLLRIITKAIYAQDAHGLRSSADLYFSTTIIVIVASIICHNMADKLPVIQYYKHLKLEALSEERILRGLLEGSTEWKSILWDIVGRIKWLGFGIFLLFVVNYSIFPGYLTEGMHSQKLKDWYPIILIFACNVFDLVGKSLSALYLVENANHVETATIAMYLLSCLGMAAGLALSWFWVI
ncbi:hypothetical protein AAC387_Pa02g1904 [Persea americana]